MEEVVGLLKEELTRHPYKQLIFRNTLPQHFNSRQNGRSGEYYNIVNKDRKCYGINNIPHWTNKYLKEVAKKYGFKYLDSFPIYAARWDLHFPAKSDCSHNCYTPETVIPELTL